MLVDQNFAGIGRDGSGVWKVNEPSPLSVHPAGSSASHQRTVSAVGIRGIEKLLDLLEVGVRNGAMTEAVAKPRAELPREVIFQLEEIGFLVLFQKQALDSLRDVRPGRGAMHRRAGYAVGRSVHAIDGAEAGVKTLEPVVRSG